MLKPHFEIVADPLLASETDAHQGAAADEQGTDLFENADHLTFEMELDEKKLLINRVKALLDTGLDADLLEAYDLVNSSLQSGKYANIESIKSKLDGAYDHIKELLENKPHLRVALNLAEDFDPAQPSPSFTNAAAPKRPAPEEEMQPKAIAQVQPVNAPNPNLISFAPVTPSPFGNAA
jgi:hypothetical protein